MGFRKFIRMSITDKLPLRQKLSLERMYYCWSILDEIKVIKLLSNPDKTSIDIGANKGNIALFMCKYAKQLYCFEPVPWVCDRLKNRFNGGNVFVENVAIGCENGEVTLNIPYINGERTETRSSLKTNFKGEILSGTKIDKVDRIPVKMKKIDDYNLRDVGFMKIDVEGYELAVINGAINTILSSKPNIYVEIEQRYNKDKAIIDVFDHIKKLKYNGFFMQHDKLEVIDKFDLATMQNIENENSKKYINNFIFTPSDT